MGAQTIGKLGAELETACVVHVEIVGEHFVGYGINEFPDRQYGPVNLRRESLFQEVAGNRGDFVANLGLLGHQDDDDFRSAFLQFLDDVTQCIALRLLVESVGVGIEPPVTLKIIKLVTEKIGPRVYGKTMAFGGFPGTTISRDDVEPDAEGEEKGPDRMVDRCSVLANPRVPEKAAPEFVHSP